MMPTIRIKPTSKAERSRRRKLLTYLDMSGVVNAQGDFFIAVRARPVDAPSDQRPVLLRLEDCDDKQSVLTRLAEGGIPILGTERRQAVMTQLAGVTTYDHALIASYPGFNGETFALPSGDIIGPFGSQRRMEVDGEPVEAQEPLLGFGYEDHRNRRTGTRKACLKGLKKTLQNQDILTFSLLVGLAPPLLKWARGIDSFGIQLIGPTASGKTTATKLAASAWGRPADNEFHDAGLLERPGFERRLDLSNYQPFLLDGCDRLFALENSRDKLRIVGKLDDIFHHKLRRLGVAR
jgi:hypothetical protein